MVALNLRTVHDLQNLMHLPKTYPIYLISQKSLCSVTGHEL